ncbi:eukaryotic translation initiation factor 3 subunit F [Bombyx mandarina]|uniref:Eukaryotic translation initiation factor 3 subunit F n=2 Tax=Bombyx TaxID=7090 RepID=A0A8R1TBE8_BOMMO|nr:eukaryotic translation initiation factor 3 subunit F [Bombyx mori]XP_028039595.1 eukaryotic translation initiation factor 3 subunit F [Bombyx mandarina]ABF51376.1 eukaryotic translation initiation factor 3 subunit 5 [Bombyx mori]
MALNISVKVHPVVLFQIVDAYERRNADSHRVIGTLLGTSDKGVVEVTNCFCVPHKEHADQVEAELNYAMDVYELNRRVNSSESIVGWWATGNEVTNHSSVIHEYYSRECREPVHVTLDTSLAGGRMGLRAYVCVPLGVPNGKQGCMFTPVDVTLTCYEPEIVGLQVCQKTVSGGGRGSSGVAAGSDLAQVMSAASSLESLLEQALQYADGAAAGAPADAEAGRALLQLAHSAPDLAKDTFSDAFASSVKDLLMVVTLAQLIKTQLQLNEKLTLLTSQ